VTFLFHCDEFVVRHTNAGFIFARSTRRHLKWTQG